MKIVCHFSLWSFDNLWSQHHRFNVLLLFFYSVNVNKIRAFEEIRRQELMMERQAMNANKSPNVQGSCMWRRPPIISDLSSTVTPGANSTEKETQRKREQSVLQALYFTIEMIPDSATEPDIDTSAEYEEPKIIPLHDVSVHRGEFHNEYVFDKPMP